MDSVKKNIKSAFDKRYLDKYPDTKFNEHQYYHIIRMLDESLHEGLVNSAIEEQAVGLSSMNTPLLALMHDTAHDLDQLKHSADKMNAHLKKIELHDSYLYVGIEYIRTSWRNLRDRLDEYYIKRKEDNKTT